VTERRGVLAWTLTVLLLFLWLRFLFHIDPRFPGSLGGGALGIAGATLMLVPLAYTMAKRLFRLRGDALRTFLTIHIYAALVGGLLALVHTGHKFDNPLGVLLTAMMLIVILSGFAGRYLLQQTARGLAEKRRELARFETVFETARQRLLGTAEAARVKSSRALVLRSIAPWLVRDRELRAAAGEAIAVTDGMSALEASVALDDRMQWWFRLWMRVHLSLTTVFYAALVAHVLVVTCYGLRWWPR
jgi:hypothetical protein